MSAAAAATLDTALPAQGDGPILFHPGCHLELEFGGGWSLRILEEGALVLLVVPTLKEHHVVSGKGGVSTQLQALLSE